MRYRNELKYILSYQTSEMIKRRISGVMMPDKHSNGVYTVNNLYLDDRYDTSFHEKQRGSFNRDKYRIRYYNNDLSVIFFENKHKDGQVAFKRKSRLTADEFRALREGDMSCFDNSDEELRQEVAAVHKARVLRPAASFSYLRHAFVYPAGDVRITFDSSLRPDNKTHPAYSDAMFALHPLMEVKYTGFMPSVIAGLLHGLPLVRTEMSKYCHIRQYAIQ